ncbi:MAG: leucine-rich repeat protein [Clostridia bacterium]|nr:leucine-rich repeat protein [Clostridia bacterium]
MKKKGIGRISTLIIMLLVALLLTACISANEQTRISTSDIADAKNDFYKIDSAIDAESLNLSEVDTTVSSDTKFWVTVVCGEGAFDYFEEANIRSTLGEFLLSDEGRSVTEGIEAQQQAVIEGIAEAGISAQLSYSYTTIVSGLALYVRYGDINTIKSLEGVKDVIIASEYETTSAISQGEFYASNMQNCDSNGIFANESGYYGENMTVAVLDTGFDYSHSAFSTMPESGAISKEWLASVMELTNAYKNYKSSSGGIIIPGKGGIIIGPGTPAKLSIDKLFMNTKIPFQFDYADKDDDVKQVLTNQRGTHGTHVAGIITGDADNFQGVVPKAQLIAMKIFPNSGNGASFTDLCAALEDCLILGVDAVNMSIGSAAGFTQSVTATAEYENGLFMKLERAGISMFAASGNENKSSYTIDEKGEYVGLTKTRNPDDGIVSSPASFYPTYSVGSVDKGVLYTFTTQDGTSFIVTPAVDVNGSIIGIESLLADGATKGEYEYVIVPGYGTEQDYAEIDVNGKLAVVSRGETSFTEKAQMAAAKGAVGCIIYNNADTTINAQIDDVAIPVMTVLQSTGELLKQASVKKVVFDIEKSRYEASRFSSMGALEDLSIGVDLMGFGGSIYSAVSEKYATANSLSEQYSVMSGTSMATPNLTGVYLAMAGYMKEQYPECNKAETKDMAIQLLMSTAQVLVDEDGNPITPRRQGAGLADLEAAIASDAYLTVTGSNKTKLNLGSDADKSGVYTLYFNLVNTSDNEMRFKVDTLTFTESAMDGLILEKAYMLDDSFKVSVSNGSIDGYEVTVSGNTTARVKITITLSDEDKAYMNETFENGIYVEGFALLESLDGNVDLHIPWISFYGDWMKLPIFDDAIGGDPQAMGTSLIGRIWISLNKYVNRRYNLKLGNYMFTLPEGYSAPELGEDYYAISDNLSLYSLNVSLLRNSTDFSLSINDYLMDIIYEQDNFGTISKSYGTVQYGYFVPQIVFEGLTPKALSLANNQIFDMTLESEFYHSETQSKSYSLFVDNEAPSLANAVIRKEDGRVYADLVIFDNHYVQAVRPNTIDNGELARLSGYYIPVYNSKRNANNLVTVEITQYLSSIIDGKLAFEIADYAMNIATYVIDIEVEDNLIEQANSIYKSVSGGLSNDDLKGTVKTDVVSYSSKDCDIEDKAYDAYADEDENGFVVVNGVLTAYNGAGGDIVVPEGVKEIAASVFRDNSDITGIYIPDGCIKINGSVFYRTINLRTIRLPITLTTLGASNFSGCIQLAEINFEECVNLSSLGSGCFIGNKALTELTFPKTNSTLNVQNCVKIMLALKKLNFNNKINILQSAISVCPELTEINFNDNVTTIKDENVTAIPKLEVINFFGTVGKIGTASGSRGHFASLEATSLREVNFYGNVTSIDGAAFSNAPNLTKVAFGGTVGSIGDMSFGLSKGLVHGFTLMEGNRNYTQDEFGVIWTLDGKRMIRPSDWQCEGVYTVPGTMTTFSNGQFSHANGAVYAWGYDYSLEMSGEWQVVVSIAYTYSYFDDRPLMTGIKFSESVTTLPNECFMDNTNLTFDYSNIAVFGDRALRNTGFSEINIGAKTTKIGLSTFSYCKNLSSLTFENPTGIQFTNKEYFYAGLNAMTELSVPDWFGGVTAGMFKDCENLVKVTLLGSSATIPNEAFSGCTKLEEVIGLEDTTTMNYRAFAFCAGLHKIKCDNLASVGMEAFLDCVNLQEVPYGDKLSSVSTNSFGGCAGITSVYIPTTFNSPNSLKSAFYTCINIEQYVTAEGHTQLKAIDGVLYDIDCTIIYYYPIAKTDTIYTIPETVTMAKEGAFINNSYIKEVTATGLTSVSEGMFAYTTIEKAYLPSLVKVGNAAFYDCSIREVYMPLVAEFGPEAFRLSKLEAIELTDNVTSLGAYAFADCDELKSIKIGAETVEFDYSNIFSHDYAIVNIEIDENNPNFAIENDMLMNGKRTLLIKYFGTDNDRVVIPEGIKKICAEAFIYNTTVREVCFPSTLVAIGDKAFFGCTELKELTFTSSIAPYFEGFVGSNGELPYNNFIRNIQEGQLLDIVLHCPNDDSYYSFIWTSYFVVCK